DKDNSGVAGEQDMSTLELPRAVPAARGTTRRRFPRWDRMALLFLLPWFVHLALFTLYPLALALYGSVSDWDILSDERTFVGLRYFGELLEDPFFFQTLRNTAVYLIIQVPLSIVIGLFVATLLNQRLPGWQAFRGIYFLPVVVPMVVLAIVWRWMLGTNTGIANYALGLAGIPAVPWLTSQFWAMPAIALMKVWADIGFYAVIFLAALQGIPGELLDAARVDGANDRQVFWQITVPMLNPVLVFCIVMGTLWAMQVFAEPLLMTEGGPAGASTSTLLYLYRQGFDFSRLGFASAGGIVIAAMILILVGLERKVLTRDF
ncbi:MAG: carbohydrate ABC transporter permease, partial [Thermomicrobiales bacterium]